ncbi:hypothetical protein GOV04_00675 [Candidatus Woesearchaeota archaeon]|nr:hypothetical protein [Candidatus Woesearchaeota archaeon]
MKAIKLYEQLEKDFITPEMSDKWAQYMEPIKNFLSENFKKRSMGIVCDNTEEIDKVYTAVFPSNQLMQKILDSEESNVMLFVHHPCIWDIRNAPKVFENMDVKLLKQFQERQISIYNLHVPLDNYSPYATSVTLAEKIGLTVEKSFGEYFGALCGVISTTELESVGELKKQFEKVLGHQAKLYAYGSEKPSKIAVIAGGGNEINLLEEMVREGVNTFIVGVSIHNDHASKAHKYAKKHGINILGGTHYSTEKFACIEMCEYFSKLGLESEFLTDKPILEDM